MDFISLYRGEPLFGKSLNALLNTYARDQLLEGRFFTPNLDTAKSYASNRFPSVVKEMKVPSGVLNQAYKFKDRLINFPTKTFEDLNPREKVVVASKNMLKNYKPSINFPATLGVNINQGLGYLRNNVFKTLATLGSLPFQAGLMTLTPTRMGNAEIPQLPKAPPRILNSQGGGGGDGGYQPTTTAQNRARTASRVSSSGGIRAYGLASGGLV